jgi:hypothetical protein
VLRPHVQANSSCTRMRLLSVWCIVYGVLYLVPECACLGEAGHIELAEHGSGEEGHERRDMRDIKRHEMMRGRGRRDTRNGTTNAACMTGRGRRGRGRA